MRIMDCFELLLSGPVRTISWYVVGWSTIGRVKYSICVRTEAARENEQLDGIAVTWNEH